MAERVLSMKSAMLPEKMHTLRSTVLIADEHRLVRVGIKMLVSCILSGVHFLEADDGTSLLRAAASALVRLALVDLKMPGMQGGRRLAEMARQHPNVPLVIVSALSSAEVLSYTINVPTVYAFVPKSADPGSLRAAIEAAVQGRKMSFAGALCDPAQPAMLLTPRQQEIRALLRQGMSNKVIAGMLGIREGTVKNHITGIFKVLNATNRTQAAQLGLEAE